MKDYSKEDLRDAFFEPLNDFASKDPNLIILTDDMDAFALRKFKKNFPKQYYNMGVAEQNMINVAAGLASCGKNVYLFGILSFVTFRCYEQIKFNICSRNLNVKIVGLGAGLSFGFDGPTHHGMQDIIAMNLLPEMRVLNPSDGNSCAASSFISYESKNPCYIRIDKGIFPKIYNNNYSFNKGYKIVKTLESFNIITTGYMTSVALKSLESKKIKNKKIGLIDIYDFNNCEKIVRYLTTKKIKKIMIIEENAEMGGLSALLSIFFLKYKNKFEVINFSLPNKQIFDYGSREWLLDKYGLSIKKIINKINSLI